MTLNLIKTTGNATVHPIFKIAILKIIIMKLITVNLTEVIKGKTIKRKVKSITIRIIDMIIDEFIKLGYVLILKM